MRRRKLLVALAGLALVVAAGVVVLWPRPERVTRENWARIQIGMGRAEVEAVLGPDGDFKTRDCTRRHVCATISDTAIATDEMQQWDTDTARIAVRYSKGGTVASAMYSVNRLPETGPVETLLSRARYLWHRWFP
jgi:hypothetical protein